MPLERVVVDEILSSDEETYVIMRRMPNKLQSNDDGRSIRQRTAIIIMVKARSALNQIMVIGTVIKVILTFLCDVTGHCMEGKNDDDIIRHA